MAKTSALLFIQQVKQEIAKVTWPTRNETVITSIMVFIITTIAAIFFLAIDYLISMIIGKVLG